MYLACVWNKWRRKNQGATTANRLAKVQLKMAVKRECVVVYGGVAVVQWLRQWTDSHPGTPEKTITPYRWASSERYNGRVHNAKGIVLYLVEAVFHCSPIPRWRLI